LRRRGGREDEGGRGNNGERCEQATDSHETLLSGGSRNRNRAPTSDQPGPVIRRARVVETFGNNQIVDNRALGNGTDLTDQNLDCDDNVWANNTFGSADPDDCID
jgi:hypothetical protein